MNGTYVGTGSGSALLALCGFGANGVPVSAEAGLYETLLANTESRFVFNPDGTGTLEVLVHVNSVPNPLLDDSFPPGLRFPWVGDETITGSIAYTLDPRTGEIQISDVSTQQQWVSGPLAGVANTAQIPLVRGTAILSDDRKALKFTASSEPLTLPNVVLPACTNNQPAQVAAQLSSMAIRQNQAPELVTSTPTAQ